MHPVMILIPAAVLIFGPRLWVKSVLKKHSDEDDSLPSTGGALARELLDRHELQMVKVESTDVGDHYDPEAKAVRLSRDKFDSKSLTAVTTAAHEVSHALQDASDYGPFVWRTRLVKLAQVTGNVGTVVIVAVPATALLTRHSVPPGVVTLAFFAMLGAGLAAQLAALPTELNASFGRALPMLRKGYIRGKQEQDARKILFACSVTYVASSLVAFLNFWPWFGRGATVIIPRIPRIPVRRPPPTETGVPTGPNIPTGPKRAIPPQPREKIGVAQGLVRQIGKPVIRGWFRLSSAL